VAVVKPEPLPLRIPLRLVVTASVPELVTGELETVKPEGMVRPTEVTVPEPLPADAHTNAEPFHCK
jgi:hypothetical protein